MERGILAGKTHLNRFRMQEKTGVLFFGINYGCLCCLDFGPGSLIIFSCHQPDKHRSHVLKQIGLQLNIFEKKYRFRGTACMDL
jgi:hypothetical protein